MPHIKSSEYVWFIGYTDLGENNYEDNLKMHQNASNLKFIHIFTSNNYSTLLKKLSIPILFVKF